MDSFYGGRHGISFIIVEHFDSVKDMLDAFSKGGDYEKVDYGEFVIIDTIVNKNDKNSLENGLIYCRGFDYQEPYAKVPDINDYREGEFNNVNKHKYELAMRQYFKKPGAGAVYVGQVVGPQGDVPRMEILSEKFIIENYDDEFKGTGSLDIVSGKEQNTVTYAYCNIRDEYDNIVGCAIGFTIPYHVIEINAESASAYDPIIGNYDRDQKTWSYHDLINKLEGNTDERPYYSLWQIKIPKGIHGVDLVDFAVDPQDQQYYYRLKDYSELENGEITRYDMGVYHKVIVSTYFDESTSEFVITYTTGDTDRIKARFLYDIIVDPETNRLKVFYSDYENGEHVSKLIGDPIKFIERIEYDSSNQKITVYYNTKDENGEQEKDIIEKKIKVIEKVEIDENKRLNVYYNTYNDDTGKQDIDVIPDKIKVIESIKINNDNKIEILYNTHDDESGEQDKDIIGYAFKFLHDVRIDEETQKVTFTYIVGTDERGDPIYEEQEIGSAINYIKEMAINPQTYHLLVLYSDPAMRAAAIEQGKNETYTDKDGQFHDNWWNLGYVRGETGGVHIIGDVDSVESLPVDGPPDGYQGWIYTVTINGISTLYAYDYTDAHKGWYPIGSLDSSLTKPMSVMIISEADVTGIAPAEGGGNLNEDGYWFVLKKA